MGGELFDMIISRGHFSEHDAANVARVILQVCPPGIRTSAGAGRCTSDAWSGAALARALPQVVEHCHLRGVIHRDLKPENFLLKRRGAPSVALAPENLRAADFGLAAFTEKGRTPHFSALVGSAFYCAPEVLKVGRAFRGSRQLLERGAPRCDWVAQLPLPRVPVPCEGLTASARAGQVRSRSRPVVLRRHILHPAEVTLSSACAAASSPSVCATGCLPSAAVPTQACLHSLLTAVRGVQRPAALLRALGEGDLRLHSARTGRVRIARLGGRLRRGQGPGAEVRTRLAGMLLRQAAVRRPHAAAARAPVLLPVCHCCQARTTAADAPRAGSP